MRSNLAIFDGDFIPYTATMGNKVLDNAGNPIKQDGKFVYTPKLESEVYNYCDEVIKAILNTIPADRYIGYLGGCKSFRYEVYPEYKANRRKLEKPAFFEECRNYLVNQWNFVLTSNGLEADDAVNIVRNNFKNDYNCIIVSPDKDIIKSIEGTYFNPRLMEKVVTSKEEALEFFWKSMITGDVIDNIKGIPGKGEAFFKKMISLSEDCHTLLQAEVLDRYIRHFGSHKGIEEYYKNYKCLRMLDEASDFIMPQLYIWDTLPNRCYGALEEFNG